MAEYLKIPELARRLDVSEKTARRYIKEGVLPSVFIGGAYRVSEEDLDNYLQGAKVQPGKAPGPVLQLELDEQGGASDKRHSVYLEIFKKHMTRRASAWEQNANEESSRFFADWRTSLAYTGEVINEAFVLTRTAVKELGPAIDQDFALEDAVREKRELADAVKSMLKVVEKVKARDTATLERAIRDDPDHVSLEEARLAQERRATFELLDGELSA